MKVLKDRKMPSQKHFTEMVNQIKNIKKNKSLVFYSKGNYLEDEKKGIFPMYDFAYFHRKGNLLESFYYSWDYNLHEPFVDNCKRNDEEIKNALKRIFELLKFGCN